MRMTFAMLALMMGLTGAHAAGCLKGALVGGVIGHYAGHHGFLGAAAGCIYGRHQANEEAKRRALQEGQPDRYYR